MQFREAPGKNKVAHFRQTAERSDKPLDQRPFSFRQSKKSLDALLNPKDFPLN
jgi:hypothetical protein